MKTSSMKPLAIAVAVLNCLGFPLLVAQDKSSASHPAVAGPTVPMTGHFEGTASVTPISGGFRLDNVAKGVLTIDTTAASAGLADALLVARSHLGTLSSAP